MSNLSYLLQIVAVLTAIVAPGWAILSFIWSKRSELALKRTELIIEQSEFLDNDNEMRECTLMLYGKHPKLKVDDFLVASSGSTPRDEHAGHLVITFEKYLNFLWRIAYVHLVLGTLTRKDLCAFGAYFKAVRTHTELRNYCLQEGYGKIITAAELLDQ
jgi:hypothetical protein